MTVVHYDTPPPLPASQPGDELEAGPTGDVARLRAAAEYAGFIADTEFVPEATRGRTASIAATLLAGAELGLKPMASLRMIRMIKGNPSVLAEGQRGLVAAAGHEIWFEESTLTRAIACGRRKGSDRVGRITWTMDDAKRAGLAGGHAWRTYPAEMLRARASAALARAMFADVTLGIPAVEELDDEAADAPPLDAATDPAPKPTRKRSRPALAPTPPPEEQPEPDPEPPPDPASDAQLRRMFALFREEGIEDRAGRLAYTEQVIGRKIDSSKDLSKQDASRVIDALQPEPPVFRVPDGVQLPPDQQAVVDEIKAELQATLEAVPDEQDSTD